MSSGERLSDPVPMGLYGFGVCCTLSGAIVLGLAPHDRIMFGPGMVLGGVVQALAALIGFINKQSGVATIFSLFGFYWISYALTLWPTIEVGDMYIGKEKDLENVMGLWNAVHAVIVLGQVFTMLSTSILQVVLLASAVVNFGFFAVLNFTHWEYEWLSTFAGVWLVLAGALAVYVASALFMNPLNPVFQLPLGDLSKPEKTDSDRGTLDEHYP